MEAYSQYTKTLWAFQNSTILGTMNIFINEENIYEK